MNSTYLLREILHRIFKYKILIILTGIVLGALLFLKAKSTKALYTSKATVFPLNSPNDNALSTSTLTSLLGVSDANKSFSSSEASINIIELAQSRNVREAVAAERLPEFGNKTIAELLVQEQNNNRPFFTKKTEWPDDSVARVMLGGKLLLPAISSRINRNDVLELNFTSTDPNLVKPISDVLISKISQFYINLRIEKATADYNFIIKKIDSLRIVLAQLDATAINMYNTTLFTTTGKLDYELPKENLSDEKTRVARERDVNENNREEALWRLQKVTPIIAVLDKPDPPYDVQKPSSIIYGIVGFIIGCILGVFFAIAGLLYRFAKAEIYKAVYGDTPGPTPAP